MTREEFTEQKTRESIEKIDSYLSRKFRGSFDVTLTPKVVDYMLSLKHDRQRKVREEHVKEIYDYMSQAGYCAIMPMSFDDSGLFVDGQHRLKALQRHYLAGDWAWEYPYVTVLTMLTKEEVASIDMTVPRNARDNLNLTENAQIPRRVIEAITFEWQQFTHPGSRIFAPDLAAVYYAEHPRSWPRFVSEFKVNRSFPKVYSGGVSEKQVTSPMLLAFKEFYSNTDDDTFNAFVGDLFAERPKNRILAAYRQMVEESRGARSVAARLDMYWKTVDMILQYLSGKPKSKIKFNDCAQDGWTDKVAEKTQKKNAKKN